MNYNLITTDKSMNENMNKNIQLVPTCVFPASRRVFCPMIVRADGDGGIALFVAK